MNQINENKLDILIEINETIKHNIIYERELNTLIKVHKEEKDKQKWTKLFNEIDRTNPIILKKKKGGRCSICMTYIVIKKGICEYCNMDKLDIPHY